LWGGGGGRGAGRPPPPPDRALVIGAAGAAPAINGIATTDPSFGLPAVWVDADGEEAARVAGLTVIDPITVLMTQFSEVVSSEVATLLTRPVVTRLIEDARTRQPGLIEELIPAILGVPDIQRVLQNLLAEGVTVANFDLILEHLADLARTQRDPAELTEQLRQRLSYAICNQLRGDHPDLAVLSLDPRIENQIASGLGAAQQGGLPIEPGLADRLIRRLSALAEAMHRDGRAPVLLCGAELRRHLKAFTRRSIPRLAVVSVNEIPMRINLKSFDVVKLEG
jgi:flagellar biosynthesis protein FlhA